MKTIVFFLLLFYLTPSFATPSTMKFDIYLDDKNVGTHQVKIEGDSDDKIIEVKADMQIDILFITVFRYQHEARERWHQSCITELETKTNYGGELLSVSGQKIGDELRVVSTNDSKVLTDCVRTYAYWDIELLKTAYLLNTQNGKYEQAELINEGQRPLIFNGNRYGSQRYRLSVGDDVSIQLWYGEDNSWQGLETKVDGGRTLRYLRQEIDT